MKEFRYTNKNNFVKQLLVFEEDTNELGEMRTEIWSLSTGDFCSSGYNSKQEIVDFLKNYNLSYE